MCPHCGQNAPLVYRGVSASCSACGAPRIPFTANAVNLRGKPSKIGGTVASVLGWVVLAGSLAVALVLGAILQAIFPAGAVVGWVVGGLIAIVGVAVAMLLLFGGHALRRSGKHAAEAARLEALGSLAAHHRGIITTQNAAEALGLPFDEADRVLTALAKQPESGITLEVDDEGKLTYRFARFAPPEVWPGDARLRVGVGTDVPQNAGAQVTAPMAQAPPPVATRTDPPGTRGATEIMPTGQPVGPQGTKLVPVRPGPQTGVRVDARPATPPRGQQQPEAEVVPLEDEVSAERRGMRS
jgi:hypothetical protein